ncbi:LPP20 family lipoprotein [Shewanella gelidimarina]|uniref:LPP20 family lipoprotein n=1 Tax=Shewanella gelidimarina TaxID=56813 RepID=UPI00200BE2C4|nr:LPP20 family lipoprotein [Shewanella gelidimarina]MCL1059519.1 LPP20 family lipoprotein [Shewanella gelidimarina]
MIKSLFAFLAIAFSSSVYAWPEWVTHTPQYDDFIVGVGTGSDRIAARDAALSEIVAQLSVDYRVEQTQTLSTNNSHTETNFKQSSQMNSLPFTLEGVQELKAAQLDNESALLLGIKKSTLIANLENELAVVSRLSKPPSLPTQKFIWALHYGETLELANKRLRVLNLLGGENAEVSHQLESFQRERRHALDAISCKVIASNELTTIKSALSLSLPQSGNTELWVKANLKWKHAKRGSQRQAQANLQLTITETESPFRVLHQRHLVAEGTGSSTAMAKSAALQRIETQVQAPISKWMFDN